MISEKKLIMLVIALTVILAGCIGDYGDKPDSTTPTPQPTPTPDKTKKITESFVNFSSEKELREYIQSSEMYGGWIGFPRFAGGITLDIAVEKSVTSVPAPTPVPTPAATPSYAPTPERVSTTTVQVAGIDEPDIVKTDGKKLYLSNFWIYPIRFIHEIERGTKIISAFPPEEMEELYEVDESGNLLLYKDTLVIFGYDRITAYRIAEKPEKSWKIDLDSNFVSARLYNGKIYLITRTWIDYYEPCPIKPLSVNGKSVEIKCTDIYHPAEPVTADITYNVMVINPETGEIEKKTSFIGSSGYSVVYMSTNAIYITYYRTPDQVKLMYGFLKENTDLVSEDVIERVEKLLDYNISNRAKSVEINVIIEQYINSLEKDERLKFENEFWNRMMDYEKRHKREFERTQIVKVSLDLKPVATGDIPGRLLNQFSMDEYNGYLRVATTVRDTNDLYVLDERLKIAGKIEDYGENERIYAVRFIGDKGYIVTFKQTDPLFVVDLSNPQNPEIKGELKIPGFSSYLHPISEDLILGIGKEGANVKVSLFDVSDPSDPKEVDKYILKEYWSDVLNTHHAFLLDSKHEVFFLPGGSGGYIFSYTNGLELEKAVDMPTVRALYIDDFMYIIGEKIVVFDENTWEVVTEFDLT